jgi:uncharacterized membrane protein
MGRLKAFLAGTIVGGSVMYFGDERFGRQRRRLFESKIRRLSRETAHGLDVAWRDLSNRSRGTLAEPGIHAFSKWTPGTRLLGAGVGALLMANCAVRRNVSSALLGTLGFGIAATALKSGNTSEHHAKSLGGVWLEKSFEIGASVDDVFEFFTTPENYKFISDQVTDVQVYGNGRFSKDMKFGPVTLRFIERFTARVPGELIESQSEPGSAVRFEKHMRLMRQGATRTRVHVRFYYEPLGGMLGHLAASAFGFDAKSVLDDLFMRAKHYLETGRQPHDAARRDRTSPLRGTGSPEGDADMAIPRTEDTGVWPISSPPMPRATDSTSPFPPAV